MSDIKVGDELVFPDRNRPTYGDYRKIFKETRVSWICGTEANPYIVNKKTLKHSAGQYGTYQVYTEKSWAEYVFVRTIKRDLMSKIQACNDFEVWEKISKIMSEYQANQQQKG